MSEPMDDAEHLTRCDDDCIARGETSPRDECAAAQRSCGHHCNHSWTHDQCCWCGKVFAEEDESPDAAELPGEAERPARIACPNCKGAGGFRWRESDGSENGEKCWTCDGFGEVPAERTLTRVELVVCDLCLDGAGGQCSVPECAFCRKAAPDIPLRGSVTLIHAES